MSAIFWAPADSPNSSNTWSIATRARAVRPLWAVSALLEWNSEVETFKSVIHYYFKNSFNKKVF
jgi:hypothetical protein